MFALLRNLFGKPAPEGRCSRFGAAKAFPATPEEAADIRRLEAALDAAWRRAWLKAQQQNANLSPIEWRG